MSAGPRSVSFEFPQTTARQLPPSVRHSDRPTQPTRIPTAIVYCGGNFAAIDGKTANGVIRHSERCKILSIIDSEQTSEDSGVSIGEPPNAIPIFGSLSDSVPDTGYIPDDFLFAMASASRILSTQERALVLEPMELGMDIVNGLQEFLNDGPQFAAVSKVEGIVLRGTDCAIGKRTTATILTRTLNELGLNAPMTSPATEINRIETFANTTVIGLTINHETMTDDDVEAAITRYELNLGLPVTDALSRSTDRNVSMVLSAAPSTDCMPTPLLSLPKPSNRNPSHRRQLERWQRTSSAQIWPRSTGMSLPKSSLGSDVTSGTRRDSSRRQGWRSLDPAVTTSSSTRERSARSSARNCRCSAMTVHFVVP